MRVSILLSDHDGGHEGVIAVFSDRKAANAALVRSLQNLADEESTIIGYRVKDCHVYE